VTPEIDRRILKLRQKLGENELDGFLVSQRENLYYLSGCQGLEGYILITSSIAILATDFRYTEQAARQSPQYEVFAISGKMADWWPKLLSGLGLKRLGFESADVTFLRHQQLVEILNKLQPAVQLVPVSAAVESLRAIKEPSEVELIEKAVKITDAAYEHATTIIHSGMSEQELAWEIEKFMREGASQHLPFEPIVAAGPNAAMPHARPSGQSIQDSQTVVIDIGARFEGYGSDLTRTFYLGKPGEKFRQVYETVLNAQLSAMTGIRAGMTGAEADLLARNVIAAGGYGESFGHSLGHGIGLVVHEQPRLGPNSTDVLADGMVFTVEPGIYLPGWGGVRIEDDVVIEHGKARILSTAKKALDI
jgi:Xaa-Pro aminopeptidase